MPEDALRLLQSDHERVRALFEDFDALSESALDEQQTLASEILDALTVHAFIEEQVLYPAVRKANETLKDEVLESLEEHHAMKVMIAEINEMSPEDERFRAKVTVLKEEVLHHVEEEEQEMFPRVRKAMNEVELTALRDELEEAEDRAPSQPEPLKEVLARAGA